MLRSNRFRTGTEGEKKQTCGHHVVKAENVAFCNMFIFPFVYEVQWPCCSVQAQILSLLKC